MSKELKTDLEVLFIVSAYSCVWGLVFYLHGIV